MFYVRALRVQNEHEGPEQVIDVIAFLIEFVIQTKSETL